MKIINTTTCGLMINTDYSPEEVDYAMRRQWEYDVFIVLGKKHYSIPFSELKKFEYKFKKNNEKE